VKSGQAYEKPYPRTRMNCGMFCVFDSEIGSASLKEDYKSAAVPAPKRERFVPH